MKNLDKKVIIVTGGSGLIGSEIIKEIESNGGISINADVNVQTNEEFTVVNCDITNEQSIKNTIELVFKKYGRIDGLVNNAYPRTDDWGLKFESININSWKLNVDMQMNSVFVFCQAILPLMIKQNCGSIVNVTSIYGVVGPDFSIYDNTELTMPAAYSAIKGGIINFTRYLSSYCGKNQVRVNCISPGGIFNDQPISFVKNYESKVPMRRMGKAKDISPAIAFLLSDEASYITGQNIIIDGGWTSI
jgi:NAD(P)-dependent dehydrogenase (short-subunit alcohol dehydrogenase family)